MTVREVNANGIDCRDSVKVIWGVSRDTIGFVFNDRQLLFYSPSKDTWCDNKEKIKFENQVRMYTRPGFTLRIVRDRNNDKYLLKIIQKDGAVAIYIINIHEGLPTYQFGFGCNECETTVAKVIDSF